MAHYGRMQEYDDSKEEFRMYCERLEQYFVANKIADESKVPVFLSLIGPKTYTLLRNLLQPVMPKDIPYDDLCSTLEAHFEPKKIIIAERFKFYRRNQLKGESTATYIVELKRLAASCAFKSFLDEALRDRLVCGLADDSIQKRLIAKQDLTFQQAVELATMFETANKDSSEIHEPRLNVHMVKTGPQRENKREGKPKKTNVVKCFRCDGDHYANKCKFKETICNKCSKKGHIARACKSKIFKPRPTANMVTAEPGHSRHQEEEFNLYSVKEDSGVGDDFAVYVKIHNKNLCMTLDTAADLSTVSEKWYKENLHGVRLEENQVKLNDYNSTPVKILGHISANVKYKNDCKAVRLHVVEGDKPSLFGKDMISAFNIDICRVLNVNVTHTPIEKHEALFEKYKSLFEENNDPIKNHKATIKLIEGAKPVFFKARSVPFSLKPQVEREINRMRSSGIWEKVAYSKWATPLVIVPKMDSTVRLCGDFKVTVNKIMHVDQYPLPTQKELFVMMNGGKYFTKLDLRNAYQQIELENASREILTINTHMGLFRPKRLFYGVSSASAVFQSVIDRVLGGLVNVIAYQDDILIIGRDRSEHDKNLELVLRRLLEFGVHLNKDKCKVAQKSVQYLGHLIDEKGIHPTDSKIKAIQDAKIPRNIEELQRFLGLFNYYIRFVRDSSKILHPLHHLLKKDSTWEWTKDCQEALDTCKNILTSEDVLVHYDEAKPLKLECDVSPVGVGAILSHVLPDGTDKPIAYASRTLTSPERNYAQIEKEALAIIFGLKKYEQYLFGRKFEIVTDHKPLISIFSPTKATSVLAAGRLQRWSVLLSAHNYEIRYRKGVKHTNADALSRLPVESNYQVENSIFKVGYTQDLPVSADDIAHATTADRVLSRVLNNVQHGWKNDQEGEFKPYYSRREQLSSQDGCLLWGFRVVIPPKYRPYILDLLHDAHPGVVKMKAVARSHLWWPGVDLEIEKITGNCMACRQQLGMPPSVPMQSWIWPRAPWERIHIDFAQKGTKYFLIVVDAHSKWMEVVPMDNITTISTINKLRDMMARYGLPKELVSDNGPQLVAGEFEEFLKNNGIRHTLVPIYTPKSNGAAERCVQYFKSSLAKMNRDQGDNTSLEHKIARFLLMQRSSPHATTGKAPSELFLGRTLRTRLSLIHSSIEDVVAEKQLKQKMLYDRTHCSSRNFSVGDDVLYRDYSTHLNKWSCGVVKTKNGANTWKIDTALGEKLLHSDQIRSKHADASSPAEVAEIGFQKIDQDQEASDMVGTVQPAGAPVNESQVAQEAPTTPGKLLEQIGTIPRTVRRSTRMSKKVVKMNL